MPLISVICSFTMSICRPSFTLLQSSVSRRPCRLPVRWLFVPTNDNRARPITTSPRPFRVPVTSKAIPATLENSRPYRQRDYMYSSYDFYLLRIEFFHHLVLSVKHMQIRYAFCPLTVCPYFQILHSIKGGGFDLSICSWAVYRQKTPTIVGAIWNLLVVAVEVEAVEHFFDVSPLICTLFWRIIFFLIDYHAVLFYSGFRRKGRGCCICCFPVFVFSWACLFLLVLEEQHLTYHFVS